MKRAVYKPLGFLFLALGALGIPLPVLPSTPFVLLAAWCFAQSSETWHRRLLESELFGDMIRRWEAQRCISRRTKAVALLSMLAAGSASITFAMATPAPRLATAALMLVGMVVVLRIRSCPDCGDDEGVREDG